MGGVRISTYLPFWTGQKSSLFVVGGGYVREWSICMSSTTSTLLLENLPGKPFVRFPAPDVNFQCSTSCTTTSDGNKPCAAEH